MFGRVLERFPLNLCLAHGGGCLPALRGRLDMGWDRKDVARTTPLPPSEYVDRLYYDTAVFTPRCCAGWSRTSVPATSCSAPTTRSSSPTSPGRDGRGAGLDPASTRAILWDTAARAARAAGRGPADPAGVTASVAIR